ncbi:MAG: hypothetical protein ACLGHQ_12395 [Acidimicrobiia bacterium]
MPIESILAEGCRTPTPDARDGERRAVSFSRCGRSAGLCGDDRSGRRRRRTPRALRDDDRRRLPVRVPPHRRLVTSTLGEDISTTYVALDSLVPAPSLDLTGAWSANGTPVTIDGTNLVAPADAPTQVVSVLRNALDEQPLDAFRRGDGWIVRSTDGFVQLEPSG